MAGRLPRYTFRGLLGVHCTLRPASSPHRLTVRLSRRLRRLRYLHRRSDSFRLERSNLAGGDLHPLGTCSLSRRTFIFLINIYLHHRKFQLSPPPTESTNWPGYCAVSTS